MQRKSMRAAAIGAALLAAMATTAVADIKDYEFQLVDKEVKRGEATIAVKLVHKPSGRVIPDAVIFAKRIDMGPEQMESMTAPRCHQPNPASTGSRPTWRWQGAGPCPWRTSSSSRQHNEHAA